MIGQQDDTRDCSAITNRESQESKDLFLPCLRLLVAVPKSPSIAKTLAVRYKRYGKWVFTTEPKRKEEKSFQRCKNGDKKMEMEKNLEKKPDVVCRINASRKEYDAPKF